MLEWHLEFYTEATIELATIVDAIRADEGDVLARNRYEFTLQVSLSLIVGLIIYLCTLKVKAKQI